MKLQNIYEKDISRHINPAVVVSELEDNKIEQEIKEYVFTEDIINNLYKFLSALTQKREGKTGVWISGYYGSGKSHFIKYLFYCLNNTTREVAFTHYKNAISNLKLDDLSEVTLSNVQIIQSQLDKTSINEIIFNVDAVSGTVRNNNTITRILFNQLNAKRGYNTSNIAVALLIEQHFDKLGLFDKFKQRIFEEIQEEWNDSKVRDIIKMRLSKVVEIAAELDSTIDKEALKDSIKKDEDYRIDELIEELKGYVNEQEENFKLIFLMDEVSQYIGKNNELLLNLQTIVEEIGSKIGNKVWIVCTAQQDLRNLINNTEKRTDDFGKIMGRFETMISLDSQDVAYITQKRVLEKSEEGLRELIPFYKANKGAIENQFVFDHDLYHNFKDQEEFYRVYPFVPYQFRLISDVFQAFSSVGYVVEGVKNTERSILGITHYTADKQKDKQLGYFISFDNFFNDQFSKNLTHPANLILNKAFQITFDPEIKPFADRVIKVLFMISNLTEDTSVNLPATIENLSLLLINDVNEVKQNLQEKVETVLDVLVDKNIIQVSEGKYKFLDDEGIKVANAISDSDININTRLEYFYNNIIQKVLKPDSAINLGNRIVKAEISIDDKIMVNGDAFKIKFLVFESSDPQMLAMSVAANELCINISQWFHQNADFKKDYFTFCKTAKYLADNKATATGTRAKTLENFNSINSVLLKELIIRFEKLFNDTSFISHQSLIAANEISSSSPSQRYQDMVQFHIKSLYKNHLWSDYLSQSNSDLQNHIQKTITQTSTDKDLNIAENEVNNKITQLGDEVILADLIKIFEKSPYGWKDLATAHIVFNLAHKKYRQIEYQNESIELKDFYNLATNSRSREALVIKKTKDYNQEDISAFKTAIKEIFITIPIPPSQGDVNEMLEQFKKFLQPLLMDVNHYKEEVGGYPFSKHINSFHHSLAEIYETRSNDKLIALIVEKQNSLKAQRDKFMELKDFIDNNFKTYLEIRSFVHDNKSNLESLDTTDDITLINTYFSSDDTPSEQYPLILKQYKNLKEVIKSQIQDLKIEVKDIYEEIFQEIDQEKEKLGITEPHATPDPLTIFSRIEKLKSLNELEILKLKAHQFKIDNFKILQEFKSKSTAKEKGETYMKIQEFNLTSKIAGTTLSSPEEVDKFIENLRKKLMVEIGKNGKIFLK